MPRFSYIADGRYPLEGTFINSSLLHIKDTDTNTYAYTRAWMTKDTWYTASTTM